MNKQIIKITFLSIAMVFGVGAGVLHSNISNSQLQTYGSYDGSTEGNYYSSISDSETGSTLRQSLETLVYGKMTTKLGSAPASRLSYSSVSSYFAGAYKSPTNSSDMVLFYNDLSANSNSYNKEHIWPNSRGTGKEKGPCGDPWVIAPCASADNSNRGNNVYGLISGSYDPGTGANSALLKYRGIASRAILYTATVWWHHPGKNSNNLELNDSTSYTSGENKMGILSQMLIWNIDYDIDSTEIIRNEYLSTALSSRNPFVDHREYACKIWGSSTSITDEAKTACTNFLANSETDTLSLKVNGSDAGSSQSMATNSSLTFTAYLNGTQTSDVTWSSSNTSVAGVSSSGVVSSTSTAGSTTITCTSTTDSSILATCNITVSAPVAVSGVDVSPSTASIYVNGTTTLTATISPTNATNKAVTWSSSNDNIASVNSSGIVTGVAVGNATITATTSDGGYTDTSAISVSRVTGGTMSITISSYSLTSAYAWQTWSSNDISGQAYIYGGTTNKMQFNSTKSPYYLFNTDAIPGPIEMVTVKTSDTSKNWTLLTNSSPYTNSSSPTPSDGNNRGAKSCDTSGSTSWSISSSDQYFSLNYSDSGVAYISEITIVYGSTALSPAEEATEYAVSFISATETCSTSASGAWAAQKTAFQDLSSEAQAVLVNATYNAASYSSNTSVQKCAQRYDLAVARQSLENFMERVLLSSNGLLFNDISTNIDSTIFTIVLSVILLSNSILILFIFKKRRD